MKILSRGQAPLNTWIKSRYLSVLGVLTRDQSGVKKLEQAFVFVLLDRIVLIVTIQICTFIYIYERCYRIVATFD